MRNWISPPALSSKSNWLVPDGRLDPVPKIRTIIPKRKKLLDKCDGLGKNAQGIEATSRQHPMSTRSLLIVAVL
jgi:hypothetical protein